MINVVSVRNLLKWYFSNIPFVAPTPADIDAHFTGFNYDEFDAKVKAETSEVYIALRKNHTPPLSGSIRETGTAQQEGLSFDIYCVKTVGREDWEGQLIAQEQCKQVLVDFENWIYETLNGSDSCDFPILKYLVVDSIPEGAVERFGEPEAFGWFIRLTFQDYLSGSSDFDPVTAPPVWDVPEGSVAIFKDGKWTYTTSPVGWAPITFFAIAGQNSYTEVDVPDLKYMVGKSPKIVGLDSTNLVPSKIGWDNTNFTIDSNITLDGTEYITIIYS